MRISLRNPLAFAESTYFCGIRSHYLYSLVAESTTKKLCRPKLRYRYLYAESTETLPVEFTYICKSWLWNPGLYRHKTARLFSAPIILVTNLIKFEISLWKNVHFLYSSFKIFLLTQYEKIEVKITATSAF